MKAIYIFTSFLVLAGIRLNGQSLEIMPGTERVFADAQWLKFFDSARKWSLFSRTRATVDYEDNTNLFSGAYLNYTTSSGVGGTVLGRISNGGAGSDVGAHLFKANDKWMLFALASVELSTELSYGWFSILRFTPSLSDRWRLYSSLELFSNFGKSGHVASVQRMRLGLNRSGYQFGLGLNLTGIGKDYSNTDTNPGLFVRKEF